MVITIPLVPKTIPKGVEEDKEDEENNLPLSYRTLLARDTKVE